MNENVSSPPRSSRVWLVVITVLMVLTTAVILLDIAELQAGAMIDAQKESETDVGAPPLDLALGEVVVASFIPIALFGLALVRRWTLVQFLAASVAFILVLLIVAGAIAFGTYRFWRDNQPVDPLGSRTLQHTHKP